MPTDTYAVLAELMSTWNRPDAMEFAQVMVDHIVPPYRALIESYDKRKGCRKRAVKPISSGWKERLDPDPDVNLDDPTHAGTAAPIMRYMYFSTVIRSLRLDHLAGAH